MKQIEQPKSAAGKKEKISEPNWETFEVPTLEGQADRKIYNTAYFEAYANKFGELTKRVSIFQNQGHEHR